MSSWKDGGLPSRASTWVTLAARFPPELSPATAGALRDAPSAGGLGREPACRGERVVGGGGERVLRGEPALGRHDQAAARQRQLPQRRVVAGAAEHEAAAVQEQHRMQDARTRPVHAHGQRALRPADLDVLDRVQLAGHTLQEVGRGEVVRADRFHRQLVDRRGRLGRRSIEQLADLGVELGHGAAPVGTGAPS